jgi:CRISPR-associated endonuclease/helicase Cas3
MIDEDPVAVVVSDFGDAVRVGELLDVVRALTGPIRDALRELRDYTVSIPQEVAAHREVRAMCRPVVQGCTDLWEWFGGYDEYVGIDEGQIGKETVW